MKTARRKRRACHCRE